MLRGNGPTRPVQLLVHNREPDIRPGDALLIAQLSKQWVVGDRTHRKNEPGGLARQIVAVDFISDGVRKSFVYRRGMRNNLKIYGHELPLCQPKNVGSGSAQHTVNNLKRCTGKESTVVRKSSRHILIVNVTSVENFVPRAIPIEQVSKKLGRFPRAPTTEGTREIGIHARVKAAHLGRLLVPRHAQMGDDDGQLGKSACNPVQMRGTASFGRHVV